MDDEKPGDTLADVSGQKLQDLLAKRQRRGRHSLSAASVREMQHAAALVEALPGARQAALGGNCGAPAKRNRDQGPSEGAGLSEELLPQQDWHGSGASSSEDDDWEAVAHAYPHPFPQGSMELSIDAPGSAQDEEREEHDERKGPLTREQKLENAWLKYYKSIANKERAQMARELHRANLLCLLAHGLLLDQAANEPLVQAMALSVVDPAALPDVHSVRASKNGVQFSSLQPIATWFSGTFRQLPAEEAARKGDEGKAGGVDAASERLQQVASQKEGIGEELVALFVAIMRSLGLLARTVRALDVLPLKPSRSEGGGKGRGSGQPSRHKPASAKPTSAPKAPRESRSPKRQRAATSSEAQPSDTAGADAEEEAVQLENTRRGGRGSGSRGCGRGRGRRKAAAAKGEAVESESEGEQVAAGQAEGGRRGRSRGGTGGSRGRGRGRVRGRGKGSHDEDVVDVASAEENLQQETESLERLSSEQQRKRKGDLEYENQLAMAMQASMAVAAEAPPSEVKTGAIPAGAAGRAVDAKAIASLQRFVAAAGSSGQQAEPKSSSSAQWRAAGSMWARSRRDQYGHCWAEVYCGSAESGGWVHVDPLTGAVDRAQDVEKGCVREAPMAYVVAFSGSSAKDVTQRYVKSFRAVEKLRDEEWWQQTMRPLRPQAANAAHMAAAVPSSSRAQPATGAKGRQRLVDLVAAREDAELQQKFSSELQDIPNTIPAFKSHPRYVLERHIGRYQALKPGTAKLGLHRGEPFFPREALQDLHTVDMWQRKGREVTEAELARPAKTVNRRGTNNDSKAASTPEGVAEAFKDDDEEDDPFKPVAPKQPASAETKLYGYWQTVEWIPPQAKDGIVPKNERGNVMCPPLAHALPLGTVHLSDMPRVSLVCKALGVDYAVAMTGFETRGGQSVPVFEGVVVCEEHADAIREKYWATERERQEKAENKARAAAEANWRNLLRSIFTRIKVQGDYADAAADGSGEAIDEDDNVREGEDDEESPIVLDDLGEERLAPAKSGAAAAVAVAAAKADVAAREVARRTWKDPVAAARERTETSNGAGTASVNGANGHAASGEGKVAGGSAQDEHDKGPSGAGAGRVLDEGSGARAANGKGVMKRKRTRSGMVVDCEEI